MSRGSIGFFHREIVVELQSGQTIIPFNPSSSLVEGRRVDLQSFRSKYTHFAAENAVVTNKFERTDQDWRKELPLKTSRDEAKLMELLEKRKACLQVLSTSELSSDRANASKELEALNMRLTMLLNDALPDKFYTEYAAYAPEVFRAWMNVNHEQERHHQADSSSAEMTALCPKLGANRVYVTNPLHTEN